MADTTEDLTTHPLTLTQELILMLLSEGDRRTFTRYPAGT